MVIVKHISPISSTWRAGPFPFLIEIAKKFYNLVRTRAKGLSAVNDDKIFLIGPIVSFLGIDVIQRSIHRQFAQHDHSLSAVRALKQGDEITEHHTGRSH